MPNMKIEKLPYFHNDIECMGYFAYDDQVKGKRPAIMVAHAWRGQDEFARDKAIELAELGFLGFAIDIYGDGIEAKDNDHAKQLMAPFFVDRNLLRERCQAAYFFLKKHPIADIDRLGAIGFCFGGLSVYELFRSGVDLKGVVCFHPVLANEKEGISAKTFSLSPEIHGSILILNGADDPMVSTHDLFRVEKEFSKAKIDWQIHSYGNTMHAFTNPMANDVQAGTIYNEKSKNRAWKSMKNFFDEVFL